MQHVFKFYEKMESTNMADDAMIIYHLVRPGDREVSIIDTLNEKGQDLNLALVNVYYASGTVT